MLGPWGNRVKRQLTRYFQALSWRRRPPWRGRLAEWTAANVKKFLKSSRGDKHLDEVATELAQRLAPVLARLNAGAAVLDDRDFAQCFHYALSWLAFQGDVT